MSSPNDLSQVPHDAQICQATFLSAISTVCAHLWICARVLGPNHLGLPLVSIAALVNGGRTRVLAAGGAKAWSTARCRRKVAELRSSREAHRLQAAFVAGHEARVENAKLRAASAPCGGKLSAVDRLRLLRERELAGRCVLSCFLGRASRLLTLLCLRSRPALP